MEDILTPSLVPSRPYGASVGIASHSLQALGSGSGPGAKKGVHERDDSYDLSARSSLRARPTLLGVGLSRRSPGGVDRQRPAVQNKPEVGSQVNGSCPCDGHGIIGDPGP